MLYDFLCSNEECAEIREDECSMHVFKEHHPPCLKCGALCNYVFTPSIIQFAMKDGPSGISPSKAFRFKDYRQKQSEKMEKRQKDRYGHVKRDAIPNHGGVECESWREAQSLAIKEKGLESASTYNSKIAEEKSQKIIT